MADKSNFLEDKSFFENKEDDFLNKSLISDISASVLDHIQSQKNFMEFKLESEDEGIFSR